MEFGKPSFSVSWQSFQTRVNVFSVLSHVTLTNTSPGWSQVNWKCWNFFILLTFFVKESKNLLQSNTGTMGYYSVLQPADLHWQQMNWTPLLQCLVSIQQMFFYTFALLIQRRCQEKFSYGPQSKKRVIFLCLPVNTRHIKYASTWLFLFWPLQLSACRWSDVLIKEMVQQIDDCVCSLSNGKGFIYQVIHSFIIIFGY